MEPEEKLVEPSDELIERSVDSVEEPAQTDVQAEPEAESGELEVSIEGDSPPPAEEQDSSVIREMRKALREKEKAEKAAARRAKELEAELEAIRNPKVELGPKPTILDDDINGDEEKYDSALLAWNERKRKAEAELEKQKAAQQAEQNVYAERLERYQAEKRTLRISGIEDAEAAVRDTLSNVQQSVLVRYFERPAVLVAAIGSNPETAKKLAAISDPIEFAFAVRDLESKVKTSPRKPPSPAPSLATTRSLPSGNREQLLLKAALETGDFNELHKFRQEQRKRS